MENANSSMKKSEVAALIYENLGSVVTPAGFRFRKREARFVRHIPAGRQDISVALANYRPEYQFSLVMGILLDAVEHTLRLFIHIDPTYNAERVTTLTQLTYVIGDVPERYAGVLPGEYKVEAPEDIAGAMAHLLPVVERRILPFFDRYQTIAALNDGVNRAEPSIDSTLGPIGDMHAMILARLADAGDFERVVASHQAKLAGRLLPEDQERIDRLVAYLREHAPGDLLHAPPMAYN
jgi:hypothetical protein